MDQAEQILARAGEWVREDTRLRAALVHGSVARGDTTPLSDVDLVVVAEPGSRDELWEEREAITRRLLGAEPATANTVPHQGPYRWQARTAQLDMLDLTINEATVEVWPGLGGDVLFLVDRGGVREEFNRATAELSGPEYDVAGQCDITWGIFAWVAGSLLHQRTYWVRICIGDVISQRLVPLLERPAYTIGAAADDVDRSILSRLDRLYPSSTSAPELARALKDTAFVYAELLTEWADRTGSPRPSSELEPGTLTMLARLVRGELSRS
jgi:hypothetical protein